MFSSDISDCSLIFLTEIVPHLEKTLGFSLSLLNIFTDSGKPNPLTDPVAKTEKLSTEVVKVDELQDASFSYQTLFIKSPTTGEVVLVGIEGVNETLPLVGTDAPIVHSVELVNDAVLSVPVRIESALTEKVALSSVEIRTGSYLLEETPMGNKISLFVCI
jgi:hypothetical protein